MSYYPPPNQQQPPMGYPPRQSPQQPGPGGYPPQQQGYPPPQQGGYPPPQQGYPPPQQGYPPPQQGYPPQDYSRQGPPQGYPPQGPPQGYPPQGYPPPQNYQQPPPAGYPAPQQGYQQPPPQGYPPAGYPPPQGPPQGYPPTGYPPQGPPQGYPPPNNFASSPTGFPPAGPPPPLGPRPPTINVSKEIFALHNACKGFGTDEQTLITTLATRDAATIDQIRAGFDNKYGSLYDMLSNDTSGHFREVLLGTALGPVESEAYFAYLAMDGVGTNEALLTTSLLGKSSYDVYAYKVAYKKLFQRSLEADVRSDLSTSVERLFVYALEGVRNDDNAPPTRNAVVDAKDLYDATKGFIKDDKAVSRLFTKLNNAELRAMAVAFMNLHGSLVDHIKKKFSGHYEDALVWILEGALDPVTRDAVMLEYSMKGLGTKDELLIRMVVGTHWNRLHMESVKNKYKNLYGKSLSTRIKGETSGRYRDMLLALVG